MKKWRPISLPFLILVATGISLVLLFTLEPRYQKRTLTDWLQQDWDTPLMETQRIAETETAVRAIGARKALPQVLRFVQAEDDPVSLWLISAGEKLRISDTTRDRFIRWHSAEDFWWLGERGFEIFGTNAAPVADAVGNLLGKPGRLLVVGRCLDAIGKPAEPVICRALTNQDLAVRQWAIDHLAAVTDDVGVYITRIKPRLQDSSPAVRSTAVDAIGIQTIAPELAVPLLMEELRDPTVSADAAGALANFGTNALVAFPMLTNLVASSGTNVAGAALRSIVVIAPQPALPILMACLAQGGTGAEGALEALTEVAPDQALPIVLDRFKSPDLKIRRFAFRLLCGYPLSDTTESALNTAAADSDSTIANRARIILTEHALIAHPIEAEFRDDPGFGGKPLGEWLKMYDRQGDSAFSPEATNALHHIGAHAIPALLKRLVYVEPPFGLPAYEVNLDGVRGFIALGEQGTAALPQLELLLDGTNQIRVVYAMAASLGMGTNAIRILGKGLSNQFPDVRSEAAHNLAEAIAGRFPERRQEVISLLTSRLNDPDANVRRSITGYLEEIKSQPSPTPHR